MYIALALSSLTANASEQPQSKEGQKQMNDSPRVELIADYQCVCGENPLWHTDEQRLYWVDIPRGRLYRYDPNTETHEQVFQSQEAIGGFTFQQDGSVLLFMARGTVMQWRESGTTVVLSEIADERETRFNDVIADPLGAVFCGTMPTKDRLGRLYRLEPDRSLKRLLDGIGCSNGLGFSPDRKRLYYTDSPKREIYVFDYDETTGAISNQRVFVTIPEGQGSPDGLTVDAEGYVWSALWDGWCIVRFRPDGTEERRIQFPAKKTSSLAFGGKDLTDIYVTTAGGDNKTENGAGAGALFRVKTVIRGLPEFRSRIRLPE